MKFKDLTPAQQQKFDAIIESAINSQETDITPTINLITDFFSDYYKIDKVQIGFKKYDSFFTGGQYEVATGTITLAQRFNQKRKLANIFGILAHELTHKYDFEHFITNPMINHKFKSSLTFTSFPQIRGFLLSKYILGFTNSLYAQHFYGMHPAERFARKQALIFTKLFLKQIKMHSKTHKNNLQKKLKTKSLIFQTRKELFSQRFNSLNWILAPVFYPISRPSAMFTHWRLGKKLHRQIKKNQMDKNWGQNFYSWTHTFGIPHFQSKSSKQRLMNIYEIANKEHNPAFSSYVTSQVQTLGYIDDTPKAVKNNIKNYILENLEKPANDIIQQMPIYYYNYDPKFIISSTQEILQQVKQQQLENNQAYTTNHSPNKATKSNHKEFEETLSH